MITIESAIMMVWLMPSRISGSASGSSTLKSRWRGVQPEVMAASTSAGGTCFRPCAV